MQKLRLRYAKRGRLRFTSHRDIARAFERALRRAHVPMAFSQGFNPHPKISWIGAAPTGAASEAEYVEIQLIEVVEPAKLLAELDKAMPPGLDLLEVVQAGSGSLADRVDASRWQIEVPGVTHAELAAAVEAFMAVEVAEVERLTKNGMRTINVRPAVVRAQTREVSAGGQPYGILEVVVRQTTPAVRPDDVLSALRIVAALEPPVPAKATRMAQGRLDDGGGIADPLAPDRGPEPSRDDVHS
ncbi:TIGR03936 family radical SAM-associated protein [Kibdelosporangium philippinense]|uniref:TIGR03936 family radical SAM-associated protein n=1 Tax=Kibdelosporangium philippinense TaxID=211113 RepID=A0ABS8ZV33_9PSEU|nr:TIGR03936 family radical SAM-associated protein [Kibdelosporangium philippinense]MCE7011549.1 TIGR03936 family radical SAM-associated protein [Kibdelosporangium philippinense]